jgi:hypothetical protein
MDPRETLSKWEDDALRAVPVILVSARPGLIALANELAVRASLAKPFDLDVLRAIIEQLRTSGRTFVCARGPTSVLSSSIVPSNSPTLSVS